VWRHLVNAAKHCRNTANAGVLQRVGVGVRVSKAYRVRLADSVTVGVSSVVGMVRVRSLG